MIIAENRVKVPGKRFRTKISCISTRRLTTIEWLILNCAYKFSENNQRTSYVKDVFENVFQFQNSELLIKPCLKNLEDLKVIKIMRGEGYSYSSLMFKDILLTELGQVMLKDGLLPGESQNFGLEVYYNPLTAQISTVDWQGGEKEDCIELGTESDYDLDFPEILIKQGLQSGKVASGKFAAAKYRIENIEEILESDWTAITDIAIDLGSNGELSATPDIYEESIYYKVKELLGSKDISEKYLNSLVNLNDVNVDSIKGSGALIRTTIQEICSNAKVIFIHADLYAAYKKNTTFFKNKIVVIFGSSTVFDIEIKEEKKDITRFIKINIDFPINGVQLMNEKEESMSLCIANMRFKEIPINAPLAISDSRMKPKNKMTAGWIEQYILDNLETNPRLLALASLPGLKIKAKPIQKKILEMWKNSDVSEIVSGIEQTKKTCNQLDIISINLDAVSKLCSEKIDFSNEHVALEQLSEVMRIELLPKYSGVYREVVSNIVRNIKAPQNYGELIDISQKLGLNSYDDALEMPEVEDKIYSIEVITDLLKAIVKGNVKKIPRLFSWDVFFCDFLNCIKYIEAHIAGLDCFEVKAIEELQRSIEACPNLGSLQMYVSEFVNQNAYLMSNGINTYEIMREADEIRAGAFVTNLNNIEDILTKLIDSEYQTTKPRTVKKVFVIDTCALIHNPRLLLFFDDDEYVRIPTKVIDELGKIKDRRSNKYSADLANTARILTRDINEDYLGLFNSKNKIRLLIENADTTLLPSDLDPTVPDNQILSVALKYTDCDVTIISDDNAFLLASIAQNVKTMTSEEFILDHKEFEKTLERWKATVKNKPQVIKIVTGPLSVKNEVIIEQQSVNSIDERPVRDLSKYATELSNPIITYLNTNGIKTIGQFKQLTPETIDLLKAKGGQTIYKNAIKNALSRINQILDKIKSDNA